MSDILEQVRVHFGMLHPNEVRLLQRLVRTLAPSPLIVNIGAGRGTSGLAFLQARPDATLYTIDIQDEMAVDGSLESERMTFANAGMSHLANHHWFQIHGDSKDVAHEWESISGEAIDLLFIDGDHSYEGCAGDIVGWMPYVVHGGIIAVHDYMKAKGDPTEYGRTHPLPGVDEAVQKLLFQHNSLLKQVDTLIVVRKGGLI